MPPACEVVESLLPHLRRWAARLSRGLPPAIEPGDLVQLGALAVVRAHEGYDSSRSPDVAAHCRARAWRAMLDARRAFRRSPENAALDPAMPSERCPESARAVSMRPWLRRRIAALPGRLRDVVTLRYGEDLDVREIGSRLGLSAARVSQLHGEAIALLRGGGR